MTIKELPASAQLKLDLRFEGLRYTEALGNTAEHAYPNFYPYRFEKDKPDLTGKGKADISYLLRTDDDTTPRIKGNGQSQWSVEGSREAGYKLLNDADSGRLPATGQAAAVQGRKPGGCRLLQPGGLAGEIHVD